jgi:hypothetical protein
LPKRPVRREPRVGKKIDIKTGIVGDHGVGGGYRIPRDPQRAQFVLIVDCFVNESRRVCGKIPIKITSRPFGMDQAIDLTLAAWRVQVDGVEQVLPSHDKVA